MRHDHELHLNGVYAEGNSHELSHFFRQQYCRDNGLTDAHARSPTRHELHQQRREALSLRRQRSHGDERSPDAKHAQSDAVEQSPAHASPSSPQAARRAASPVSPSQSMNSAVLHPHNQAIESNRKPTVIYFGDHLRTDVQAVHRYI